MKQLREIVEEFEYDALINGNDPVADVIRVTIRKLEAVATLKRGTVLALSTGEAGDGKVVVLGTAEKDEETLAASYILADDVTVGTDADETADAYRTGKFNKKAVKVAANYAMTAADVECLKAGGILFDPALDLIP